MSQRFRYIEAFKTKAYKSIRREYQHSLRTQYRMTSFSCGFRCGLNMALHVLARTTVPVKPDQQEVFAQPSSAGNTG